jgi:hypothetical protein
MTVIPLRKEPAEPEPDTLTVDELRELGVLQEVNRRLLHPRGMALQAIVSDEPLTRVYMTDNTLASLRWLIDRAETIELVEPDWAEGARGSLEGERASGFLDGVRYARDDPEGVVYPETDGADVARARAFDRFLLARVNSRSQVLGYVVQPMPGYEGI